MAYNARQREPLLDSEMQAAIEKRGKELIGIFLICIGIAAAVMIGSYSPDDPNWMVSTDAPVQNMLGPIGASIAAPLFMIVGWGAWGIALVLVMWGGRFAFHWGEERAVSRLIFAPIAIAFASVYAATLIPGVEWTQVHSFGLGGLFGDTVLGALLSILPMGAAVLVKVMSVMMAIGLVWLGIFVLGFTRAEVNKGMRLSFIGLILFYGAVMTFLGRSGQATVSAVRHQASRHAERRVARAERKAVALEHREIERLAAEDAAMSATPHQPIQTQPPLVYASPSAAVALPPEPELETRERTGFLARMPSLIRRAEPAVQDEPVLEDLPGGDRVSAKIANAVRSKMTGGAPAPDPTRPLTGGRGHGPVPLVLDTGRTMELPPEPPVSRLPEPDMAETSSDFDSDLDMPEPELVEAPLNYIADALPVAEEPRKLVLNPVRKPPAPSRRAQAEAQPKLDFDNSGPAFELPPLGLLSDPGTIERHYLSDEALEENARMLENVLDDYGVKGEIVSVRPGPVVTMYELEPAPGLKASRVIGLADDIARSMAALSARVSTVPGRSVIGIELPNESREKVVLREILAARDFGDSNLSLPLALGKNIGGDPIVANLAKMPHLLIAGTTGSGKSVAINTMILSLLYKLTPEECRLIMIDPKMLELSVYDGIPHLLSPVVTDPKKAVVALKWVVGEMEERYRKMSKMGVRNIAGFNARVADALAKDEMFTRTVQTGFDEETGDPVFETEETQPEKLPYIVVIVDEMADLMMVAGKEIEACIQRLAQMARASGIHLIMATQRPSVDVITGTIKANFPTRISFQVTSKVDSRTILGEMGAEQLLGMGDMLYMAGGAKIIRCHGPFVSDEEVEEIVNHLKAYGPPDYVGGVVDGPDEEKENDIDLVLGLGGNTNGEDALYDQAVGIVIRDRKCSTSYIQRKLAIGYNKAARLVEQMEDQGVVSAANHVGKREVLIPEQ